MFGNFFQRVWNYFNCTIYFHKFNSILLVKVIIEILTKKRTFRDFANKILFIIFDSTKWKSTSTNIKTSLFSSTVICIYFHYVHKNIVNKIFFLWNFLKNFSRTFICGNDSVLQKVSSYFLNIKLEIVYPRKSIQ